MITKAQVQALRAGDIISFKQTDVDNTVYFVFLHISSGFTVNYNVPDDDEREWFFSVYLLNQARVFHGLHIIQLDCMKVMA